MNLTSSNSRLALPSYTCAYVRTTGTYHGTMVVWHSTVTCTRVLVHVTVVLAS